MEQERTVLHLLNDILMTALNRGGTSLEWTDALLQFDGIYRLAELMLEVSQSRNLDSQESWRRTVGDIMVASTSLISAAVDEGEATRLREELTDLIRKSKAHLN